MTRARKVHRFGFYGQGIPRGRALTPVGDGRLRTRAACGVYLYPGTPDVGYSVIDLVFATFPTERRCRTCESKYPHLIGKREVAQLWIITVEILCLELARLGAADVVEVGR